MTRRPIAYRVLALLTAVCCVLSAAVAFASVPWMINYQGRLTDTGSKAITGTYILTFRLYDAATSGTKLWQEEQTITLSEADNGVFNVVLGAVTALDSVGFNSAMWLSVQVADDSEMTPRQRLTAAGYALNADQVDGLNSTSFVRTDADSSSSGKLTLTKAGTALVITPSSAPTANTKMVDVQNTSGTSKFSVDYEGDVTVAGDLSVSGTISGSSSATGTTSATWTIDNDNTSGTEPASGAGLVIEGGSGDVSALWDATNDELDVNKTTNITGTLKLSGSTSGYVGLAPAAAAGSTTYTLPSADGSADYVLKTNGSGTLAWAAPGGLSGVGDVTDIGDCDGPTCFTGTEGTTLTFKGSTSGTIALQPAAVAGTTTITMPATTGTLITTGDSGTVTSTMILNDTILNADINSSAAIAFSKLASLTSAYLLVGNASNVATAVDPSGDVDIDNAGTFTIQANSVALSTDTTGNYVASVATSSPLSGGAAGSEGATLTLSCPTCLVSGGGSDLFTLAGTSGTSQTISSGDTLTIAAGTGITTTAGATDTVTVAATLGTSISGSEVDANTLDFADFEDTLDLDAALTLNQTTSTWSQSFTGTTTTGLTYTATDLTSGTALDVNATNTHTADAAIQQVRLDLVNAQATAANSDLAGFNVNFTNSPTIAGNTEAAARIRNVATSNTTDNAVASLLILDNADTSTSGSTAVTDALRVTVSGSLSSGIVDAIDASDANIDNALNIGANVIAGTNFAVNTSGQVATGASAGNQGGSLLFYDTDATSPESITVNAGNVSTSYTLTLPTAVAGSNGQVLSSQTDGTLSWATVDTSTTNEAPVDAEYVVSATNGTLTAEDVFTDGLAIDSTNAAGTLTVAFDPTELLGSRTWGDASTDTIVWTWDRATGTDVTMTIASGAANFSGLQEAGSGVLSVADQHAGTDVTADLEEETHASEHSLGGTDAVTVTNLASACTDAQVLGGTSGGTGVECQSDDDTPDDDTEVPDNITLAASAKSHSMTFGASNTLTLDAFTNDSTTTGGVVDLDVDSGTDTGKALDLNIEALLTNNAGTQTVTGLNLVPVQGSTGALGTHVLYGAYIQNLATSGTPSGTNTEYGLRIGTGYDYAAYLESPVTNTSTENIVGALSLGATGGGTAASVVLYDSDGSSPETITLAMPAIADAASFTLTLPADDGTPNQVLQTNGSGVLTWATVSGISGVGDVTDVGNCDGPACFTGTEGTTLTSTTSEILDLGTDATLIYQANTATAVTFTGKDDAGAADTIYDTTGAGAITVGSADVTSITLTTDGTGTAEVALPAGSIDGTEILNDTVALTTDTTGDYVGTVADGTGIDGTASGEGSTYTPTFDATELSTLTWGSGSAYTWTFNAGTTDPTIDFNDGSIDFNTDLTLEDATPSLTFTDSTAGDDDYIIVADADNLNFRNTVASSTGDWVFQNSTPSAVATLDQDGRLTLIDNGYTTTGGAQPVLDISDTVTVDGAAEGVVGVKVSPTINVDADPTLFGGSIALNVQPTFEIDSAVNDTSKLGLIRSRPVTRVSGADIGARTVSHRSGYETLLSTSNTGSGTTALTVTDVIGFWNGANSVGASTTVTNMYGFLYEGASNSGTLTNQYGMHIKALTAGTSDYGLRVDAADTQTLWVSGNADNTTAAAGIAFGSSLDTNLYRSAADTLKTDDTFIAGDLQCASAGCIGAAEIAADALLYDEIGDPGAAGSISFASGETATYDFAIAANTSQAGSLNLDLANSINTTGTLNQTALDIDLTNANHTGGTTNLYGIDLQVTDNDATTTSNVYALNIGSGFDAGIKTASSITTTGKLQVTGANLYVTGAGDVAGLDGGVAIDYTGSTAGDSLFFVRSDQPATDTVIVNTTANGTTALNAPNVAGGSANPLDITTTLLAMNGSDTFEAIDINLTNANHTDPDTVDNSVTAIDIAGLTGDAQANEYALVIGSGWDRALSAAGTGVFTLGASDTLTVDAAATDNTGTTGVLDLDLDTTNSQAGIDIDVETITDVGVDTVSGIKITATQTSTDDDVLYGLNIANLAGTADSGAEYGITVGTGWDRAISANSPVVIAGGANPTQALDVSSTLTNTTTQYAIKAVMENTASSAQLTGAPVGIYAEGKNSNTVGGSFGFPVDTAGVYGLGTGNVGSGITLAEVNGIQAKAQNIAAGTVTTAIGLEVLATANSGGGAVTNNYGIFVANQTVGTSDYGIYVGGADTYAVWVDAGTVRFDGTVEIGAPATANTTALCWDNSGNSNITDCNGSATDLAENFGTSDRSLEAGDLVVVDPTRSGMAVIVKDDLGNEVPTSKAWVSKSATPYDPNLLGVISTSPNQLFGDDGVFSNEEHPVPVSLAGRVPVKVSLENGPIAVGDYLTSSSTPGVAMRATEPGMAIGVALGAYDRAPGASIGKIMCFISLGERNTAETLRLLRQENRDLRAAIEELRAALR